MEDSDIYFSTLQSLRAHATKLRKKDEAEEKRLMEYLSVNERIELERENKVLTKWQERQRDWERIEQRISKKLNSKIARPLMMTVTDEYRSKMEEYDLIQAAIPLKDRYAESSWQMTLRGGGPITVAIGHIFSGLECEIDPHVPKPKMVRKPKPSTAVWKNDTFLEESENLTMKRKKYEKSIREIRPHTLTYRDAGQLVIRSMDLFQWAEESSLEYVKQQREEELARLEEEMQAMRSLESSQEQEEEITSPDHPQLTFLSSPEVVLDTQLGKQVHRTVSFKNTGPVVLYYRWKRLHSNGSSHDANKGSAKVKSLEAVHHDKGSDDASLRAFTLEQNREKFFCLNDSGEILPNETVTTDFVFDSDVGGVYRSSWILQFVPEETKISMDEGISEEKQGVQFEDQRSERDGSQVSHRKPVTGCITIALRGHCAVPDESMTNRSLLSSHISYQTEVTEIQDIIYSCVRRVRSPVRIADLQARQRDLFADYNESVYHAYFPQATKRVLAPWKLTNDRVGRLEQLQHEVGRLYDRLHDRFEVTWREVCDPSSDAVAKAVPMPELPSSLEWRNETVVTGEVRQRVLTALFPEETIDIFDEVTAEDIEPHWNFRVGTALTTLQTLATAADFLAVMEDVLLRRAKKQATLDAKLARRAAKKAAGDSDEEDDDDEDEEEDDDEDDEAKRKQRKPQHLLAIEVQSLRDAIEGELVALQTTLTYSVDTVFALTKNALCDAIDDICDMQQRALQAANLMELVNHTLGPAAQSSGEGFVGFVNAAVIAPLQNPFLSEDGAKAFETLAALTSPDPPVDPNAPPVKGKAKEAAGKKGKEVAPPPATPLQVDFYHKVFYDALRSRLIDSIVQKVDIPPPTVSLVEDEDHAASTEAAEEHTAAATKLAQAAVWRAEDVRNKVVFFTFDLAQRVDTSDEREAAVGIGFDAVGRKIQAVAEEVSAMILEGQPACLLLLSSSCASPESVWQHRAAELGQRLQYQWAKSVLQYRKRMKRAKQAIENGHVSNKVLQVWNHVDSWSALMYELLPQVLRPPRAPLSTTVPIFIVPDLTMPRLVPAVPPYEWTEDEDDDPAVAIGGDEYAAQHYERYLAAYPVRLPVATNGAATAVAAAAAAVSSGQRRASWQRRSSVKRQENEPPSCFCDISAALVDLTQFVCAQFYEDNPQAVQWVDGTTQHVFQPQLPLHKIHDASYKKVLPRDPAVLAQMKLARDSVLCSRRVRESIVWSLLPRMVLPGWASIAAEGSGRSALTEHVRHLFPSAIAEQRRPRTVFVLGGAMRTEKLRLLDELIALFPQIYLVGEVAVRFLGIQAASSSSSESGVGERAGRFQTMCRKLLAKARVMGCELVLPTDFVVGDEPQRLPAVQAKLFQHDASIAAPLPPPLAGMETSWATPSSSSATGAAGAAGAPSTQQPDVSAAGLSRSDAADYDGDARVVSAVELLSLSLPVPLPPYPPTPEEVAAREEAKKQAKRAGGGGATPVTPDAVYDIGPASQQRLREAVEASELTYIYGPAGFVELSPFQGGHNALVQALSSIFTKENAAAEARRTERKDAAKAAGKGSIAATQAAWEALQPVWLERNQHVVLLGEETVDWFARSLDPDADFRGDLVASGHVSFVEANAAFFLGHMVLTETPVPSPPSARGRSDQRRRQALLEDNLVRRPPTEREFVYSRARNLEEDEDDEEEDDEDEDEEQD